MASMLHADDYPKLYGDSLVVITPKQLKETNAIFLEHRMLKEKAAALERKAWLGEEEAAALRQQLEIRERQAANLERMNSVAMGMVLERDRELKKLERRNRGLVIGGCTVSVSLFLWAILK